MATSIGLGSAAPIVERLNLGRYRDLVKVQAQRSLKVRYRGSSLGVYWSLLNPLLMTSAYAIVFGSAFSAYYHHSLVDYTLACFVGLVVLNFFSQTTSQALTSIVSNGALLNKLEMPPSIFPVSSIVANMYQLAVGTFPLLAIVTIFKTHSPLNVVALFVPMLSLLMLTTGFSLLVSALFVFFRDLPYLYELVIFVLWLTSPIFYPAALVPAAVRPYLALNPLAQVIESFRVIVFSPGVSSLHTLLYGLVGGLTALIVGSLAFVSLRASFMDLL